MINNNNFEYIVCYDPAKDIIYTYNPNNSDINVEYEVPEIYINKARKTY